MDLGRFELVCPSPLCFGVEGQSYSKFIASTAGFRVLGPRAKHMSPIFKNKLAESLLVHGATPVIYDEPATLSKPLHVAT